MKSQQSLVEQVQEYLRFKRSCGYRLDVPGKELMQDANPRYWATRYEIVRRFAEYRFLFNPATEIPPKGLLGPSKRRLSPHIYSDEEIAALLQAASRLSPSDGLHPRTYVTLFGLLVSTGLRISEALNLSHKDADLNTGVLTIKETKFRKSRLVPVHPSTLQVLRHYSKLRDSYHPGTRSKTFFLSEKGTPLNYRWVLYIFIKLSRKLGWRDRDKKPRIHDFRHSFAVRRLLNWYKEGDWYKEGANLDQKILALSTYLGHAQVTDTYWYLSGVPELLAVVSKKFENFATKERRRDTP
ncbi:MAG: tyrosine-type recombinase/integrase [Deltaproteobacteria bacterium]|nr:tyrosine-type recombinase/integrase [Deltaproteobacteria bacterium]